MSSRVLPLNLVSLYTLEQKSCFGDIQDVCYPLLWFVTCIQVDCFDKSVLFSKKRFAIPIRQNTSSKCFHFVDVLSKLSCHPVCISGVRNSLRPAICRQDFSFVSCNMCIAGFPAVHDHQYLSRSISRRDDSCVYCAYAYLLIVASVSLIWSCSRLALRSNKRASDVARREMLVMVIERIAFSQCLESHPMAFQTPVSPSGYSSSNE